MFRILHISCVIHVLYIIYYTIQSDGQACMHGQFLNDGKPNRQGNRAKGTNMSGNRCMVHWPTILQTETGVFVSGLAWGCGGGCV